MGKLNKGHIIDNKKLDKKINIINNKRPICNTILLLIKRKEISNNIEAGLSKAKLLININLFNTNTLIIEIIRAITKSNKII